MATIQPKRKKAKKRNKYGYLKDIDVRDSASIDALGIRALRMFAKFNGIPISRTCTKRDEVLHNLKLYLEKLYGPKYSEPFDAKPPVDADTQASINKSIEKSLAAANINWEECKKLCQMMCTNTEIRGFFNVTLQTLDTKCKAEFDLSWQEYYELNSANGRIAIRRQQLKIALDKERPDKVMLIHLGKTMLGQVESKNGENDPNASSGGITLNDLIDYCLSEKAAIPDILNDPSALKATFNTEMANSTDDIVRRSTRTTSA